MSKYLLVITDLHGHLELLKKALLKGLGLGTLHGYAISDVVLLGDFVDQGPCVKELLEYLSTKEYLKDPNFQHLTFHAIAGNHDLALLLSIDPSLFQVPIGATYGIAPGKFATMFDKWILFQTPFREDEKRSPKTHEQYGVNTLAEFIDVFPAHHKKFLSELRLYLIFDQYLFIHAGIRNPAEETVQEQLSFLDARSFSDLSRHTYGCGTNYGLPDQVVHKGWSKDNYPNELYVVVTGHNKYKDDRNFVASHRIGFNACRNGH